MKLINISYHKEANLQVINFLNSILFWHENLVYKIGLQLPIFVKVYIIYALEITILLLLFDLIAGLVLRKLLLKSYQIIKYSLVKWPMFLIKVYKFQYFIDKMINYLRPGYLEFSRIDGPKFYRNITSEGIIPDKKKGIFLNFFKPSIKSLITLFLAVITTNFMYFNALFSFQWLKIFEDIINSIKFLILFPAFLFFVLIIIISYYFSKRGQTVRAISRDNRNYLDQLLKIHRNLINPISILVYKGASNLEYAVQNKERILNTIMDNDESNIQEKFDFKDIEEIGEVMSILKEAEKDNLYTSLFKELKIDYDLENIQELKALTGLNKLEDELNIYFMTSKGFHQLLGSFDFGYGELPEDINQLQQERKIKKEKLEKKLDQVIIMGIEKLVKLHYYSKSAYRTFHLRPRRYNNWLNSVVKTTQLLGTNYLKR